MPYAPDARSRFTMTFSCARRARGKRTSIGSAKGSARRETETKVLIKERRSPHERGRMGRSQNVIFFCTLVNAVSVFINAAIAAFIALTCNNPVGGERRREIKSLRNGVHDACGVVWGPV